MAAATPKQMQAALGDLLDITATALAVAWQERLSDDLDSFGRSLEQPVADIGERNSLAAAAFAADWFEDSRADAGVAGVATPVLRTPSTEWLPLIWWSFGPLTDGTPDANLRAVSKLSGAVQYRVGSSFRDTLLASAEADPAPTRYGRVGHAGMCAFCTGAARKTYATSDEFKAHDSCRCSVHITWR